MDYFAPGIQCKASNQYLNCLSSSVTYRVCSCLFLFSLLLLCILLACPTKTSLILNEGLFFSKFVIIAVLTGICFQMENSYFEWFGWMSKIFSYIFVACQSMILIDLAYLWGIKWAKKYSNGSRCYAFLLIFSTILMFAFTAYFLITRFNQPNHL